MRDFLAEANQALASGKLLLEAGDAEGAANRAYYAVFHAMRAALARTAVDPLTVKTHNGLRRLFHQHVVSAMGFPADLAARAVGIEAVRIRADYSAEGLTAGQAEESLREAAAFLRACIETLERQGP